jgi:hypothetical protein
LLNQPSHNLQESNSIYHVPNLQSQLQLTIARTTPSLPFQREPN